MSLRNTADYLPTSSLLDVEVSLINFENGVNGKLLFSSFKGMIVVRYRSTNSGFSQENKCSLRPTL